MSRTHTIPLLLYSLISLLATWPLPRHLSDHVPGLGDWGQNMWALWWTRYALLNGLNPFHTNHLFYPKGVSLLFHPLDLADGLLTMPLYGLLGGPSSYNLIILLSFILSGYTTYLLALHLTHNRPASFVAGLVFTLSPYHFLRLDLGHLNLATIQWLPLYLLFALKTLTAFRPRHLLIAVLLLLWTALHSWYYVIYLGMVSLAMLFWPAPQTPLRHRLRLLLIPLLTILLLLPLLLPMFRMLGSTTLLGAHEPLRHSVDLYSFWLPGPPSTWAAPFESWWISYAAHNREPGASAYFGYTVLIISLISLLGTRHQNRRRALWWAALALGFTMLALGPRLQIDGQIWPLSLPYGWLAAAVPLFSITGIPGRFIIITSLALAMLTAYGLAPKEGERPAPHGGQDAHPPSTTDAHPPRPMYWILIGLVSMLILLEYAAVPLRLSPTAVPDFYHRLAAEPSQYALLDIKWDANYLLHAQTVHQKPLVGGWLARLPAEQAAYLNAGSMERAFMQLLLGNSPPPSEPTMLRQKIQNALTRRRVRYIIDHNQQAAPFLEPLLGWPLVYKTSTLQIYGNPAWPDGF